MSRSKQISKIMDQLEELEDKIEELKTNVTETWDLLDMKLHDEMWEENHE